MDRRRGRKKCEERDRKCDFHEGKGPLIIPTALHPRNNSTGYATNASSMSPKIYYDRVRRSLLRGSSPGEAANIQSVLHSVAECQVAANPSGSMIFWDWGGNIEFPRGNVWLTQHRLNPGANSFQTDNSQSTHVHLSKAKPMPLESHDLQHLRSSPEHHRASLDSWRRIWDWN
jgi:hypothetical protein